MYADAEGMAAGRLLAPERAWAVSEAALAGLAARRSDPRLVHDAGAWAARLADTLMANVAAGRFTAARRFNRGAADEAQALADYARQALQALLAEADRVAALAAGESAAWAPVLARLERRAYHWLGPGGRAAWAADEAREASQATCADLWQWLQGHRYPFDVPFDRWAARALLNRLRGAARQRSRRDALSLDALALQEALLANDPLAAWLEAAAAREALAHALAGLPPKQAAVVRWWYLEGWPPREIAAHLGERVGNVYLLRCRGLKALRRGWPQHEFGAFAPKPVRNQGQQALLTIECSKHCEKPGAGGGAGVDRSA